MEGLPVPKNTAMEFAKLFRHPHLLRLWVGQVLSAVGDQLYSIAVIWISVKSAGPAAGFVAAAGSIAGLCLGLLGGVYADRWNRRSTMIVVDILRALTVFSLALAGQVAPVEMWQLGLSAAVINALDSLFNPALQASLPALTENNAARLQAMNALMQMNHRLARTIGPALAGWLVAVLPIHHFFSLDAISFLISAVAIFSISKRFAWKAEPDQKSRNGLAGIWDDICSGARVVRGHRQICWGFIFDLFVSFAWSTGFVIGFPLLIKENLHGDVGAYGAIVAAYGVGAVLSNLVVGNIACRRRMLWISNSNFTFLVGFSMVAFAPNLAIACLGSALSAVGGPIGDIPLTIMMQMDLPGKDLGKAYSLRTFVCAVGNSLGLLSAAWLFGTLGASRGILFCACIFGVVGLLGILKFGKDEASQHPSGAMGSADLQEVN